jgi:hypothetical protein
MNPTLLEDYIEILEAEDFLDGRHKKLLEIAKEELAKAKDELAKAKEKAFNDIYKKRVFDLDRVDYDTALALGK